MNGANWPQGAQSQFLHSDHIIEGSYVRTETRRKYHIDVSTKNLSS